MTKTTFAPTDEQQEALRLFATGKSLAIEAGAGAGKTSTLKLLAESTPRRGQYIAFNKSIVTEAKEKFPTNVACNTAHSLAFRSIVAGTRFAERLRDSRRMKSTEVADRLHIDPMRIDLPGGESKRLSKSYLAGLTMRGVGRFCQSADAEPTASHVPYIDGIDIPPVENGRRNHRNNDVVARALVPAMRRAWADLSSEGGQLRFGFDHYLKLWHLSGPKINADYILFDEAQDANPVLVDIVRQQTHAQLVWVGDSNQQIYSFTGAINALASVGAEQTAMLSQSFRFGPAIADIANRCLEGLKAPLRLTGTDTIPSLVAEFETDHGCVILSRTNAAAVRELLAQKSAGRRPHLVGGGREVSDFAKAARDLQESGFTSHPELACFGSWDEVQTYVEQDEQGGDLRLLVSLVDDFGVQTIIDALERMPREEDADLILSTAHKAKGREWNDVKLADDFPAEPSGEELRLLYVACTRAKLHLDITAIAYLTEGDKPAIDLEAAAELEEAGVDATDAADPDTADLPIDWHAHPRDDVALGPPTMGDSEDADRLEAAYGPQADNGNAGGMKVRVGYTTTVGDDYRRAINLYYGKPGLATRAEVRDWLMRYGESMDDDLMMNLQAKEVATDA